MKKTYPVSNNAKHVAGWRKHLRREEKRRVNKSTRKLLRISPLDAISGDYIGGNDATFEGRQ